jgi:hypothetical protein
MSLPLPSRPTAWTTVILLFGKCARKMKGGYGHKGKETLRALLRTQPKAAGYRRSVRVIETRCPGSCPKQAALNATRPARLLTIPKGTTADEALAQLVEMGQEPSIAPAAP